jgi:ubiquinone/menaquinone biosynthesis C-methylase UbiE
MSGDMDRYLQSCRTEFWEEIFRWEVEYLLRHLQGRTDILSIGCGPGIIEGELSERGFRVTGLDPSREALALAPDGIGKVTGRAEDMPFPESSFDAVIYVASLQFIEDYGRAIEKTARVLRPDGTLIVMLLNPKSAFFARKRREAASYVRTIRHVDVRDIERVIAETFSVETEYFLGVAGDAVFESCDPSEAALYVIRGVKRRGKRGRTQ